MSPARLNALSTIFYELELLVARVDLEAGPISQWLHAALAVPHQEVVLLETLHVKAAPLAMTVKTDRKDAKTIARMLLDWLASKRHFGPDSHGQSRQQ